MKSAIWRRNYCLARGADQLGERLAEEYNLNLLRMPANWDLYGKRAGYLRNSDMAMYAAKENGVLVTFWDGKSRGTKHMIDLAHKHELAVHVVNFEKKSGNE